MVVDDPHSEMEPSVCRDGGRTCGNGSPVVIGSTPDELVFFCMHPDVIAPIAIERLVNVGGAKKQTGLSIRFGSKTHPKLKVLHIDITQHALGRPLCMGDQSVATDVPSPSISGPAVRIFFPHDRRKNEIWARVKSLRIHLRWMKQECQGHRETPENNVDHGLEPFKRSFRMR